MARCPKCRWSFPTLDDETDMHGCPHCGYSPNDDRCPDCGTKLYGDELPDACPVCDTQEVEA